MGRGWAKGGCYPDRHAHTHRSQHDYLARILNARVYEVAIESPLQPAPYMSRAIKNTVLLKVRDVRKTSACWTPVCPIALLVA